MSTLGSEADVPTLVRRYLDRVLPPGGSVPGQVRVTQVGEMWQKPGARALPFTAVEEFAVEEVAFTWHARFSMFPLVWMRVRDEYSRGEGLLEARLLGLVPVMRQSDQETAKGEAMRYLAELPWVPHAMLANRELDWREVDTQTVEAGASVGPRRVAVRLEFDPDGDIVRSYALARPRPVGKTHVPTPWGGVFSDYEAIGGIRLPTRADVRWELPEGPFTYWRGTITGVELAARG